jgi:hypothetical protein
VDLDSVADELYSLPLAEFTAARNARARQAKSTGQSELAAAVSKLAKPTAAAWLANQLVREQPTEIRRLIEVGAALQSATVAQSGVELRELGKRQRQLVNSLVDKARVLAGPGGPRVSPDVARALQDTLHAALSDSDAAARLLAARLAEPLSRSGFELAGTISFTAPARPAHRTGSQPKQPAAKPASEAAAAEAAAEHDRAEIALASAEQELRNRRAEQARLHTELAQAAQAVSAAEQDQRRAQARSAHLERLARAAARRLEQATPPPA